MGNYTNLFKSYHPTIEMDTLEKKLLVFPMSIPKITNRIKRLLSKYGFENSITPKCSSKLSKHTQTDSYYETIKLSLKCNANDCSNIKTLTIELIGFRNEDNSVEYNISAIVNSPSACSIYKGIVIRTERDVNYYLNSLLRKIKK